MACDFQTDPNITFKILKISKFLKDLWNGKEISGNFQCRSSFQKDCEDIKFPKNVFYYWPKSSKKWKSNSIIRVPWLKSILLVWIAQAWSFDNPLWPSFLEQILSQGFIPFRPWLSLCASFLYQISWIKAFSAFEYSEHWKCCRFKQHLVVAISWWIHSSEVTEYATARRLVKNNNSL